MVQHYWLQALLSIALISDALFSIVSLSVVSHSVVSLSLTLLSVASLRVIVKQEKSMEITLEFLSHTHLLIHLHVYHTIHFDSLIQKHAWSE